MSDLEIPPKEYPTWKNPLGLKLGEKIYVDFYSLVDYVNKTEKKWVKKRCPYPNLFVTGYKIKCTGTYTPASSYSPIFGDDDYTPASLKVDKRVLFYTASPSISSGKVYLIHPSDIKLKNKRNDHGYREES